MQGLFCGWFVNNCAKNTKTYFVYLFSVSKERPCTFQTCYRKMYCRQFSCFDGFFSFIFHRKFVDFLNSDNVILFFTNYRARTETHFTRTGNLNLKSYKSNASLCLCE